MQHLDDPFLSERLNPLFLQTPQAYWQISSLIISREIDHLQTFAGEKNRDLALCEKLKNSAVVVDISTVINTFDNPVLAFGARPF